jgi:hypothetical protein
MGVPVEHRGVVITDNSVWTLDGNSRYRRTARSGGRPAEPCIDGGLTDATWVEYTDARFEPDDYESGRYRLWVIPTGRPPGSAGICTGPVCWTNLPVTCDDAGPDFGPAAPWFPPSPVPADSDLWPTELPFTAFGQFGPDALDLRVFDQDVYWVDRHGAAHRIDTMSDEYVCNVLEMLTCRAAEYHSATVVRSEIQSLGDAMFGKVSGELLAGALGVGCVKQAEPDTWLASTPLVRGLRRRGER